MRLLETTSLTFKTFQNERTLPLYAILSHRWEDEEILLADIESNTAYRKKGYRKLAAFCHQAKVDGYPYLWVDTCCIDKSSSAELTEAINSMYRWYRQAAVCYAYLYDFDEDLLGSQFDSMSDSVWFTRSWTLQELIAPPLLIFFDRGFQILSTKAACLPELSRSTGIPETILNGERSPSQCRVSDVMQWAARRTATREEDVAYSLLGLFDINIPMLYGEGSKAFIRLQQEILTKKHDHSLFLCRPDGSGEMFASSPADFTLPQSPRSMSDWVAPQPCSMTNLGVSIVLDLIPWDMNIYIARLEGLSYEDREYPFIFLRQLEQNVCERARVGGLYILKSSFRGHESGRRHLYIGSSDRLGRQCAPTFFGMEVCFRERPSGIEYDDGRCIASRQIDCITDPGQNSNPQFVQFKNLDKGKVFEIKWSDNQISTVRLRFGLDFKPVCLIRNSTFAQAISSSNDTGIRSTGDDVSKKAFSEATGLENQGWSTSDHGLSYPTVNKIWAIKGPVEATRLLRSHEDCFGMSVEFFLSKSSEDQEKDLWSFTLIKDI